MERICNKCNVQKKIIDFNKDKICKDGFKKICKICCEQKAKEYIEKNLEKVKIRRKKYYENNKEEIRKKARFFYKNNLDLVLKKRESQKENKRKYYLNNKERLNNKSKVYFKERKLIDPVFKLSCNLRTLIGGAIRRRGYTKKSKVYFILGCSFKEFKEYLENKFSDGMNWENSGQWHLDHIYPVSLAKNEEELIKLNHHTNFQPLWAIDNMKKSNKIL